MGTMSEAHVAAIYIYPEVSGAASSVDAVTAIPARGLEGDRYFASEDAPHEDRGHDLTLVEAEAIEMVAATGISFGLADSRRNIVTRGVSLNDLVGQRFRLGEVECKGVRLCHPCAHMESLSSPGVLKAMVDRGGLRAAILNSGQIRVGDSFTVMDPAALPA
jgi:MOSC domain-containing protein YiiM